MVQRSKQNRTVLNNDINPRFKKNRGFLRSVVSKVALFYALRPKSQDTRKSVWHCSLKPIEPEKISVSYNGQFRKVQKSRKNIIPYQHKKVRFSEKRI